MSYQEQKKKVLDDISANRPIIVDTNVIIKAALLGDVLFLQQLAQYDNFHPLVTNLNELYGLINFGQLRNNAQAVKLIKQFMQNLKNRPVKIPEDQLKAIVAQLDAFTPLLPRKLAHDVVIEFVDTLIALYKSLVGQAATLTLKQKLELGASYQRGMKDLKPHCREHFYQIVEKLHVRGEYDSAIYFNEVDRFVDKALNDIQNAVIRSEGDINVVIDELNKFKKKTYTADITMVASAITKGLSEIASDDSDVRWLFAFYALSRAA